MSKKNLFDQPGIERIIPGAELPVAVKVTGRNMHAVSLLASSRADHGDTRIVVSSFFEDDGSLSHVELHDKTGMVTAQAGSYLVLGDDRKTMFIASKEEYERGKSFLRFVDELDKGIAGFAEALTKGLGLTV